jgi:hypothetical protein
MFVALHVGFVFVFWFRRVAYVEELVMLWFRRVACVQELVMSGTYLEHFAYFLGPLWGCKLYLRSSSYKVYFSLTGIWCRL